MSAIRDDWDWVESPNKWTRRKADWPVSAVIIHYTAGGTAASTVNYFKKTEVAWTETDPATGQKVTKKAKVNASAHLVIGRDGHTTQMVDFNDRAWHAGDGILWHGSKNPTNINNFTIGIELSNWGKLQKRDETFYVWRPFRPGHAQYTTPYSGPPPTFARSDYWEPYPAAQIDALISALKTIVEHYPAVTRARIVGHEDVSPHRKTDPGGAFPWDQVLDAVFPPAVVLKSEPIAVEPESAVEAELESEAVSIVPVTVEWPLEPQEQQTFEVAVVSKPSERKGSESFWTVLLEMILKLFRR